MSNWAWRLRPCYSPPLTQTHYLSLELFTGGKQARETNNRIRNVYIKNKLFQRKRKRKHIGQSTTQKSCLET